MAERRKLDPHTLLHLARRMERERVRFLAAIENDPKGTTYYSARAAGLETTVRYCREQAEKATKRKARR